MNPIGFLPQPLKFAASVVASIVAFAVFFLVSVWTVSIVLSLLPTAVMNMLPFDLQKFYRAPVERSDSLSGLREAHSSVSLWAMQCMGAPSTGALPENIRGIFSSSDFFIQETSANTPKAKRNPTIYEINTVELSQTLGIQRVSLDQKVRESYANLQFVQWLTILIGLVTTVVVSISSSELLGQSGTTVGKSIRVLAIILPAFGTAVAAINSFYNPRDDWNKSANTLASVTQLHSQMGIGIWSLECATDKTDAAAKPLIDKLAEWTKRYNDIQALADSGPTPNKASTDNATGNSGNNPPTQGKQ